MFWEYIEKTWNETSLEICSNLIQSMLTRIQNILKVKDSHIK